MYNRLDSIPSCNRRTDRQTDGQTSCHGIVRAMHTRRVVKTNHCTSFTSPGWLSLSQTGTTITTVSQTIVIKCHIELT